MRNLFAILVFLTSFTVFSQERASIQGQITDGAMNSEPLLFARVSLNEMPVSTQSNFHGNFEIDGLEPGEYTLQVSFPGYETTVTAVKLGAEETARVFIELQAKSLSMEELGAAGYTSELAPAHPSGS